MSEMAHGGYYGLARGSASKNLVSNSQCVLDSGQRLPQNSVLLYLVVE
jgi:hypothetical protein